MKHNYFFNHWLYLLGLVITLLLLLPQQSQAQVYYAVSDGNFNTLTDQLRSIPLAGGSETTIFSNNGSANFPGTPGQLAYDGASSRIFVANAAIANPSIYTVSTSGAASLFLTVSPIASTTVSVVTGMVVDNVGGYLYYNVSDNNFRTSLDQLRRVPLTGGDEQIVVPSSTTNFPATPQSLALDRQNNRLLVSNGVSNGAATGTGNLYVSAVNLTSFAVTRFASFADITANGNTTTTLGGIAVNTVDNSLYYVLRDIGISTFNDQLRRIPLAGGAEQTVVDVGNNGNGFPTSPGFLAYDAINNRLLVNDLNINSRDITAVTPGGTITLLLNNGAPAGSGNSGITGLAVAGMQVVAPTVVTQTPTGINTAGATLGGNVTNEGGAEVTERGVVYSATNTEPVTGGSNVIKDVNGLGAGTFARSIAGLAAGTTYYVRAFATNRIGTSYGSVISFTTLPNAPVLNAPANGALLTSRQPTFSGTAQPGSTVTIFLNGVSIGTTTASGGTFSFVPAVNLADNAYSAYTTATVNNSTSAQSAPVSFSVDATAPTVTSFATTAGASGGATTTTPFTFLVSFSESVTGLSASGISVTNGTLTAGPTGSGSGPYSFEVTPTTPNLATTVRILAGAARDAAGTGNVAPSAYSLTYQIVIALSPSSLPSGTVGVAYNQAITASGGTGPYTYSLASGALPPGLTLSSGGTLSGTPTGGGVYSFTVTARDASTGADLYTGSQAYALTINAPTIGIAPSTLPDGAAGSPYSQTLIATGGTGPYTYAITAGSVPPGLSLSAGGTLSGTPTSRGSFTFSVTARDASTGTGSPYTGTRTYTVFVVAPTITLAPLTLTNGAVQRPYSQTLTASGGTGPYTYAVTAGSVPPGLSLSAGDRLSGTPTSRGSYTFTLTATDANGYSGSRAYTLLINAPTITGLQASPAVVCLGSPVTITASIGQLTASYDYTLTVGNTVLVGTASGEFSQRVQPTTPGQLAIRLTVFQNGQASATTSLTVSALPTVSLANNGPITCTQPTVVLTATGNGQGEVLTYQFSAGATQVGGPSSNTATVTAAGDYRVTAITTSGCSATAQTTIINSATLATPTLLTQSGQSAVTVDLNTTPVTLLVGGCSGTASWTGSNGTSGAGSMITVPTSQPGQFVYQATCQVGTCVSNPASATVTIRGRLTVLHRDVDNYADNNAIQPLLQLQNQGVGPLALSRLTLRYYVTVENGGTLSNLNVSYAQVGNQNVRLRYVALSPTQPGASGYVEYSFTDGAGSLAAGANSGSIQGYFTKSDYGSLFEPDDYSYNPVRDQLTGNVRITAYYDGVLIAGLEPGSTAQIRSVRALTESRNGPDATQINTVLEVRNEGTVALNYSDLRARYYFTSDGNERLQVEVDEGNVSARLVRLPAAVGGADTYLEISYNQGGQLAPGASTGAIRYRISKPDGGRFNQANDYSYQEQPQDRSQNSRVVVLVGNQVVWGTPPSGAPARLAYQEAGSTLSVKVLGNPIQSDQVSFEVTGAEGQALQLQLLTPQGRVVNQQLVPSAEFNQRHQFSVAGLASGLFLLQVSTPTQSQTVKVIKAN